MVTLSAFRGVDASQVTQGEYKQGFRLLVFLTEV